MLCIRVRVGEVVIIQATVVDDTTGLPFANASVEIAVTVPGAASLTSTASGCDGLAFAHWQTHETAGKKEAAVTSPGLYTATVMNVVASGYTWDGTGTNTSFTLE